MDHCARAYGGLFRALVELYGDDQATKAKLFDALCSDRPSDRLVKSGCLSLPVLGAGAGRDLLEGALPPAPSIGNLKMISIETIESRASELIERALSDKDPVHYQPVFLDWATSLYMLLSSEGDIKGRKAAAARLWDRIQHAREVCLRRSSPGYTGGTGQAAAPGGGESEAAQLPFSRAKCPRPQGAACPARRNLPGARRCSWSSCWRLSLAHIVGGCFAKRYCGYMGGNSVQAVQTVQNVQIARIMPHEQRN